MSLSTIQDKLNKKFKSERRTLVFWYDDNASFADEVDSLQLENAKLHKLTGDNAIYTKYLLEYEDRTSNYLIYAPFPKLSDRDNHLADTAHYSELFYTDKVAMICEDLGIPDKYRNQVAQYAKFWKSGNRTDRFAALGIEEYTPEIIEIGMLAVVAGVKAPNFEEILKNVIISGGLDDNKYLSDFDKLGLTGAFWSLCERYYGYDDKKPTLEKLMASLLITYTDHHFEGELPKAWRPFILRKKNDVAVLVSNMMNNALYREQFDALSERIAAKLRVEDYVKGMEPESYAECDAFEAFDQSIVKHMASVLVANAQPLPESYAVIVENRIGRKHFAQKYEPYYEAIRQADRLIACVKAFAMGSAPDADGTIALYAKEWSKIDRHYRGFYTAFDKISAGDDLRELRSLIENIYANDYLGKLSVIWSDKLEKLESFGGLKAAKQPDFYIKSVAPLAASGITAVIISDGLRYECGQELCERLNDKANAKPKLEYMVSSLPSETHLGMAALLPHDSITINDSFEPLVDDLPCVSTDQRAVILQLHNTKSAAFTYTDIMNMSREDVRRLLSGKELLYIYHNQVDARGDNAPTENEVFDAANEAIDEIVAIIQKLTVDKSITKYIITADHGFLYRRDKLSESDKVNLPKQTNARVNKRFIMSDKPLDVEGALCFSLDYLGKGNEGVYVTVPRGADVFKVAGGGQNYVHGGASLQEIVIPLIKVGTERYKKEVGKVDVELTSLSRKITNLIVYLDFIQKESVSDTVRPVKVKAFFETESGEKISDEEIMVADKREVSPEKRRFHEKFTFKNRRYPRDEKYYLVLKDAETDMEMHRYEFVIDIAFADDFGFEL